MGSIDDIDPLEAWTAGLISRARSQGPLEDAFLELKATWSEPKRAARQLAGHANASSEDRIRWLVGVSETGEIRGAPRTELSNWWAQVRIHFDGPAPRLSERIVQLPDAPPLMVLDFDITHKPYVFKPEPRGSAREIPWREGTGTRPATRDEVLSLFIQRTELPNAVLLNAVLTASKSQHELHWNLHADLYVEADPSTTLVIPEQRCRGEIMCDELRITVPLEHFSFHMPFGDTHQVQALPNQVAYRAPGATNLLASGMSGLPMGTADRPTEDVVVRLELWAARAETPFLFQETLVPTTSTDDTWAVWVKPQVGFRSG